MVRDRSGFEVSPFGGIWGDPILGFVLKQTHFDLLNLYVLVLSLKTQSPQDLEALTIGIRDWDFSYCPLQSVIF
jgi:hypothetical protein